MWQEKLVKLLQEPLPGRVAQMAMAPVPVGATEYRIPPAGEDVRKGAVLLLLHPEPEAHFPFITLTLRSSRLPTHSGQLSLPGGRLEPGETPIDAALRETCEEIGVPSDQCTVLGTLTPLHVPHTHNLIHPIVASAESKPALKINPDEVAEAFHVPVDRLMSGQYLRKEVWDLRGAAWQVPFWDVHRVPLWGATAMILSEFCSIWNKMNGE